MEIVTEVLDFLREEADEVVQFIHKLEVEVSDLTVKTGSTGVFQFTAIPAGAILGALALSLTGDAGFATFTDQGNGAFGVVWNGADAATDTVHVEDPSGVTLDITVAVSDAPPPPPALSGISFVYTPN